ncbi:hypothetical protein JMJ99_11710 [Companilactobacillus zhachilii]|uniref:hypothetical protein n=1 Tax=Companilactobacillus zhachilii TaxID=2304606 RepID=UPI0019238E30|nr:hypothetical protein [Companilactobacillus zhachilii]MBL3532039.1 hypothetical protein [Companilactobacillus zhachilii]
MDKKRMQITLKPYDKENAEKLVRAECGISLNQYMVMETKKLASQYLSEDYVSPETQSVIDQAITGNLKTTKPQSADDFLKDLGITVE